MTGRTGSRDFTPDEANRAVPDLQRMLPQLRRILRDIERMEERLEILDLICDRSVAEGNADLQELLMLRVRYHRRIAAFGKILSEVERLGCLLTDLERGIVHFASRRGTDSVLLCWKEGEAAVSHWHASGPDSEGEDSRRDMSTWDD